VVFVKTQEDYLWYAAISVVGIAGNYLVNMLFAARHVSFTLKGLSFIRHIKPILYLVAVNLAIEIYTLVDVTMLGLMREATNVAFYSYGSRMSKILLTIVNSFTC
jgi:O-antigen/teichoic acid export membrane protein